MSEGPPGPEAVPYISIPDGIYKISSVHSPRDGLAPKDKEQPTDKPVIAYYPPDSGKYETWNLKKWGKTSDKYDIVTFELEPKTKLFLSYDFANKSVVLKNDRQQVWALIPDLGEANQYKIALLTSRELFLTYKNRDTEVEVGKESDNHHDRMKYLWNIPI